MEFEWKDLYISVINENKSVKTKYVELVKCSSGLVKSGEIQVLMGPSGGGKSTLMNLLAGRVPPGSLTQGTIKYNGKFRKPSDEWLEIIEFVEQEPSFLQDLTVYETLLCSYRFSMKKRINHQKRIEARKKNNEINKLDHADEEESIDSLKLGCSDFIDKIIEDLGLEGVKHNLISKLSGGEKKRTSIGMALASRPEIMFFDEPTSGLDTATSRDIIGLLKNLAVKYKKIVILTIHQPSLEIFRQFDKLILISKGNVLYDGKIENVESFFIEKGYVKNEYASTPEFVLDICRNNSRNKNQELVKKENINLGVKNVVIDDKLKNNNDNHIYATFSISDVYYLILRQLYIRRKNKWKYFKGYFYKFIITLIIYSLIFWVIHCMSALVETHKKELKEKYTVSDERIDFLIKREIEIERKQTKNLSNAEKLILDLATYEKSINVYTKGKIYIFNMLLIFYIITNTSQSFFDALQCAKSEILNHQYSSSSFYTFMLFEDVFAWTFFSLFCFGCISIYEKSINMTFLIVNVLLTPFSIVVFSVMIATLLPSNLFSRIIMPIMLILTILPYFWLNSLVKYLDTICQKFEYTKFIPYLCYIFALFPSSYLNELIKLHFKFKENVLLENSTLILEFCKGVKIKSDMIYIIFAFVTFFLIVASFSLCAYRQGPGIRMITQKG